MQLRQGLRVVRRAPDEVQVGTDHRWAVRVRGLAPEQVDRLVEAGDRALDGLPPAVLSGLATAGLLRAPRARPPRVRAGHVPEALAYGLTREDGDGVVLLRRRARATVAVAGLDRVGVAVASTLAGSGVGSLELADPAPVRSGDVGGLLGPADVGSARVAAVTAALERLAPHVRVRERGSAATTADVAVTVARDATDPGVALALLGADVPHLPVVTREADALVGPFAVPAAPGRPPTPCLRCVDLHRAEADPAWPTVLAELVAGQRWSRRRGSRPGPSGPPAALAAVAGGLAAAEVLAHLDGGRPRTRGAQYEIAVPEVEPRLRPWVAHPECGCAALTG
jgi:hypothetical protein